jgi:hypothetical protein
MFKKIFTFISVLFIISVLHTKITAQTSPETTINIHSLVTGSSFPDIVKLGNIVIDENQRRAYFTGTISKNIGVIDIDSMEMINTIDSQLEGYLSKHLFINSSNGILYMFVIETEQLYGINPVSGTISSPITGKSAVADEGTGRVFVSDPPNGIQVYDELLQWVSTISDVVAPLDMFVDPTPGRLYVVNAVIGPLGGVTVYNTTTLEFIQHYSMLTGYNELPTRVHANYGKIYVTGLGPDTIKTLSIIDETTGNGVLTYLDETGNQIGTYDDKIFLMTGYPYYAGYLPEADGSYGIIEVRDAITGDLETELWTDFETVSFDIDESSGNLLFSSTGSGTIRFVHLSDYTTIATIDVTTTIEDVIIHPDNGSLYLRNRLGGSTIYRINPETGTLINTLIPGNWPTKILLDSIQERLYILSHYEAKIYIYDILTDTLIDTISLGVQLPRTDALSTMTIDTGLNKLYVIIPELGTLTMVNVDGFGNPTTISIEGFTPNPLGGGPGQLHIAVNSSMNRVFALIKDSGRLNIYDGNTLAQLSYSTISGFSITNPPLNLLFSDDEGNRLFVGPYIVNPETGTVIGQISTGKKVVASNPARTRFYVSDLDISIQGFIESIYEYDSTLSSFERQWDFSPINVVQSSFGFDFTREKMYVGYFERGELDIFDIGDSTNIDNFENMTPAGIQLYQNYPNPFNPTTTISFNLTAEYAEDAEIVIYNIKGQKIRTFNCHPELVEGQSSIIWDGTDENNQPVGSGIYFYKLKAGNNFSETKRMLLLK